MRIAHISFEYPPDTSGGGIATYVEQAAHMMVRRGHEVEVFVSSPTRRGRAESGGVLVHRIQEHNQEDFGVVAGHVFAARHAEKPFDVLEGPEYNADARKAVELVPSMPLVVKMHTPTLMCAMLNAPSGFTPHLKNIFHQFRRVAASIVKRRPLEPFSFTLPFVDPFRRMETVESAHARQAAIVAPPCRDLCVHAESVWKIPREAIRLAPHPYTPSMDFLGLRPRTVGFTVGFVGRLEKRKGIEILAAAIPAVLEVVPEARIRFIGAPAHHLSGLRYDEWIRRGMPRHAGRLEFTGKLPLARMADAYASLDVCVFPSLWENFPNVCLEAMSAGRAVIASSAGGMLEMLGHGRVGRLVPPRDSTALAREIITLLQAPSERIRLGERARKRVLEAYNENVIGEMMERIYREAIHRRAGSRPDPDGPGGRGTSLPPGEPVASSAPVRNGLLIQ